MSAKIVQAVLFFIILSNLIVLNFVVFKSKGDQQATSIFLPASKQDTTSVPKQPQDTCSGNCVKEIYEAIHLATSSLKLVQPSLPAPYITTVPSENVNSSTVKEFYVAFGSGSNATEDWTDVVGLAAYVDSTQYGSIKKVVFEASMNIPTGNEKAYARLFNVTDKHPVWFSEVSLEGGAPKLLISDPITLDEGNKLYQVQMKTSLKFLANVTQARLHITVR